MHKNVMFMSNAVGNLDHRKIEVMYTVLDLIACSNILNSLNP